MAMNYEVTHYPERGRFEIILDGHTGYVEYVPRCDGIDIIHTIVPPPIEGRGVAAALVKAAYEYARANNLKITPSCSYVAVWALRHPEYADITTK